MQTETILVHQMTGECLLNEIKLMIDEVKKELIPLKKMMTAIQGATIERKEAMEILGVSAINSLRKVDFLNYLRNW